MKQTKDTLTIPALTWGEINPFFVFDNIAPKEMIRAQRSTITQDERDRRTAKKRAARKARRRNKQ